MSTINSERELPSRTSILVAAARAFGSRDPDLGVRNPDLLADKLIGSEELALINDHPLSKALMQDYAEASEIPAVAFFVSLMILRTRFIDEALERALENGANQIVILGAGFDSRPYRFRDALKGCRVMEVDGRSTQKYKKDRASKVLGQAPPNLTYVTVDFDTDDLAAALVMAGFRERQRSFFIWEGVSMYLSAASVRRTLQTISSLSAAGSSVVLDYANSLGINLTKQSTAGPVGLPASWGEPWIFGVPGTTGEPFFRELGFDPGTPVSMNNPEVMKRFAVRHDGTTYAAHVMKRVMAEAAAARANVDRVPAESSSLLETQKALAAAGGVYWLTELTVLDTAQP